MRIGTEPERPGTESGIVYEKNGGSGTGNPTSMELDPLLMQELEESGAKYTKEDVVLITKTPEGKLVWLEKGNESAGLQHIIKGHVSDFAERGIAESEIPGFLNDMLKTKPIKTGQNASGPFSEYIVNNKKYIIAYGTNGYIVSFYPMRGY